MKKSEIIVGGLYKARVSNNIVTVRVDAIRNEIGFKGWSYTFYDVTNLRTQRKTTFRSAAKFRSHVAIITSQERVITPDGARGLLDTPSTQTTESQE